MTRPKKNTIEYFPHDCTHAGKTLYILEERFGNDGYCFWFKLLEKLGATEGHFLDLNDESEFEFLRSKTRCTQDNLVEMLSLCARLGAIDRELWENKIVWCQNFVDRVSDVYTRNRHTKPPARPHNYAEKPRAEYVSTQINPQSKVKESKVKKSKTIQAEKNFGPEVKKLSDFLFECIKKTNSNFKGDPRKWDQDMDRLLRNDQRPYEEAVAVIMFAQNDSFWRANILSGKKLREKYDQLYMKASGEFQKAEKSKVKSYDL